MKKVLKNLALAILIGGFIGLASCTETVEPVLIDDQVIDETFSPQYEGDEEDSIRDPFGG